MGVSLAAALLVAGCSEDDGDLEAFCAAANDTGRFQDIFDGLDPDDVEGARTTFEAALDTERRLRADAPAAVRSDIDVLVGFFEDLVEGLEDADPARDERPPVYDQIRSRFDQVETASARITTYVESNC